MSHRATDVFAIKRPLMPGKLACANAAEFDNRHRPARRVWMKS